MSLRMVCKTAGLLLLFTGISSTAAAVWWSQGKSRHVNDSKRESTHRLARHVKFTRHDSPQKSSVGDGNRSSRHSRSQNGDDSSWNASGGWPSRWMAPAWGTMSRWSTSRFSHQPTRDVFGRMAGGRSYGVYQAARHFTGKDWRHMWRDVTKHGHFDQAWRSVRHRDAFRDLKDFSRHFDRKHKHKHKHHKRGHHHKRVSPFDPGPKPKRPPFKPPKRPDFKPPKGKDHDVPSKDDHKSLRDRRSRKHDARDHNSSKDHRSKSRKHQDHFGRSKRSRNWLNPFERSSGRNWRKL